MIKLTYMIKASDVLNIAREAGYKEFLEEVDYIASLFWPEDFMNDCYKDLFIDDESYEEICEDIEGCEDEDEMKELVAKKVIIEALRKYCLDNGIKTNSLLVDVSW